MNVTAWAPLAPPDYMAVDLRANAESPRVRYYATSNAVPGGVTNRLYKSNVLLMRRIPAAMVRHRQGSPTTAPVRGDNETAHWCTLSKDYYMGVYEFTEAQNTLVGGTRTSTPSFVTGDESRFYPVTSVFWYNNIRGDGNTSYVWTSPPASASTIGKLRTRTGLATIDLPTDAQWEYACRAGASTTLYDGTESGYNGDGLARAQALAWINSNASSHPHEVGLKTPNAWGLYDMLGNVLEWCRDGATAYSNADDVVDPVLSAPQFMLRGGSFATSSYDATCSSRNNAYGGWNSSGVASRCGFRPMCAIPAED